MAEEIYHFTLGDFRCITFNEYNRAAPAERMFGHIPEAERSRVLAEMGLTDGLIPSAINVLFLDTGNRKILVDTGLGQGALDSGLQAEGIPPESIDTILITHGHGDHLGDILDADNQLKFPNAQYFIGSTEWQQWGDDTTNRNAALWQRIRAYLPRERITFIDAEGEFLPGFSAVWLPGHTSGQMGLRIASGGAKLLHIADVAHHALQCVYPDWSVGFDDDQAVARQTRRRVWQQTADENLLVMGYHLLQSGRGHVVAQGETWRWEPLPAVEMEG